MMPLHPPLPTASNLPFHPDAGIHTSILMSESADGESVAVTRQNAGSVATAAGGGAPGPDVGSVSFPASTASALEIVVLASFSVFSVSNDDGPVRSCAAAHAIPTAINATTTTFMTPIPR